MTVLFADRCTCLQTITELLFQNANDGFNTAFVAG
jgi:hypothetical protein